MIILRNNLHFNQIVLEIHIVRGRSQTTLASFWLILTTYPPSLVNAVCERIIIVNSIFILIGANNWET